LATAVCLGSLAMMTSGTTAAAMYVAYTAFQWMSEPGLYALLMNGVRPQERSGAAALNALVMSSSQAVAGAVAGVGFVQFGYPAVIGGAATVAAIAALMSRVLMSGNRQGTIEPLSFAGTAK
jgi:predicted MFS family arabinose efflux permease